MLCGLADWSTLTSCTMCTTPKSSRAVPWRSHGAAMHADASVGNVQHALQLAAPVDTNLAGTPAYYPPDRLGMLELRRDVYSLGLVCLELRAPSMTLLCKELMSNLIAWATAPFEARPLASAVCQALHGETGKFPVPERPVPLTLTAPCYRRRRIFNAGLHVVP